MSFAVAIDGPAASGKGTIARAVAAHFGFLHLDTGLLYRAVGRQMLDGVPAIKAAETLTPDRLNDPSLRTAEVAQAASKAAAIPAVRAALVDFQRAFARRDGGAVLDGRDIGTVICPDAEAKLFVIASPEVRARRRCAELRGKGDEVTEAQVLEDLRVRDERDMNRPDAPLKAAKDAVTLDTTDMSIEDAVQQAIALINQLRAR
ncbi:(d)CMP kinase [Sagittula sp. S175]|uniref:(d)CMP kinase n=1 Tax=Sagittula sp. S175 TaxID=3415129 RepID=UPI003C797450